MTVYLAAIGVGANQGAPVPYRADDDLPHVVKELRRPGRRPAGLLQERAGK